MSCATAGLTHGGFLRPLRIERRSRRSGHRSDVRASHAPASSNEVKDYPPAAARARRVCRFLSVPPGIGDARAKRLPDPGARGPTCRVWDRAGPHAASPQEVATADARRRRSASGSSVSMRPKRWPRSVVAEMVGARLSLARAEPDEQKSDANARGLAPGLVKERLGIAIHGRRAP